MPENPNNLSPTERLRQYLLAQAKKGSLNKAGWTAEETSHAIANRMPGIYGLLRSDEQIFKEITGKYAHERGFKSRDELKSSLDEIKEQLRGELPKEEWLKYFKDMDFPLNS